ncbi:MAG: cysteine synthase [Candidatus Schekmanbacteria bacterium]|nr:cysteine synthase [Candidatus Schekmanbacteria bacterium]
MYGHDPIVPDEGAEELRPRSPAPSSILDLIGHTPMVNITRIIGDLPAGIEVYAKAEWFNPGGSVKDRAAAAMIADGEARGLLSPGKIILDATSGNTGIAYAMIGAAKGYRVELCLPQNASDERKKILRALGAEIVYTSPLEGSDGAIREARRRFAAAPEKYFYPDQYRNAANWRAHYESTGPEIWEQTGGRVTHLVAGMGTTGTIMGSGRFLREKNPDIEIVALEPDSPFHGLEGLKHMESAIVPDIFDASFPDRTIPISTEAAYDAVKKLARKAGILLGISSGAAFAGAAEVARGLATKGVDKAVIVTVFPDDGDKYLSESFWD